jgi:hypothetical protein
MEPLWSLQVENALMHWPTFSGRTKSKKLAFAHIACVVNGTKNACSAFRASDRAPG